MEQPAPAQAQPDDLPALLTDDARAAAAMLTHPEVVAGGRSRWSASGRRIEATTQMVRARLRAPRLRSGMVSRWPRIAAFAAGSRRLVREARRQRASLAASGAALWIVIAVFPAMIAAVNVFGLVVDPRDVARDLDRLTQEVPDTFATELAVQLSEVADTSARVLSVRLVISVLLSLWAVSAGAAALMQAIRQAYGLPALTFVAARRRGLLVSIAGILVLGLVAVVVAGTATLARASHPDVLRLTAAAVGVAFVALIAALTISALHRLALGKRVRWRHLRRGVLFATVALVVLVAGFSGYVSFAVARYDAVYGTVGGTVLALLLAYVAVYVILLGAVWNAQHLADLRAAMQPDPATPNSPPLSDPAPEPRR